MLVGDDADADAAGPGTSKNCAEREWGSYGSRSGRWVVDDGDGDVGKDELVGGG